MNPTYRETDMLTLEQRLSGIEGVAHNLIRKAMSFVSKDAKMYIGHFVIIGALKRTLSLTDAFCMLVRTKNFVGAAPILRMQLDTLLRLHAALIYEGGSAQFAEKVFAGAQVNKLRSQSNVKMTDSYLAESLSKEYPWVKSVYTELCDFVHFSDRHIFSAMAKTNDETRTVEFSISAKDPTRGDSDYFEIVDCFYETLKATEKYSLGWALALNRAA
jgi:hypothetical protein